MKQRKVLMLASRKAEGPLVPLPEKFEIEIVGEYEPGIEVVCVNKEENLYRVIRSNPISPITVYANCEED